MLLALDVGNSHTVIGALGEGGAVTQRWRISTEARTTDELGLLLLQLLGHRGLSADDVRGVCVCCVVPSVLYTVENACRRYLGCEALVVGSGVRTGMRVRTDNPREIGADRIVNAIAAFEDGGGPLVVVGFGTATIFDCVSAQGDYLGGAIAPGFVISAEALFTRAARLPKVEVERTERVIGTNTVEAMQAGMFWGYVGLTDELARRCKAELAPEGGAVRCVATGRMANLIGRACSEIDAIDDTLTLRGLQIVYERNTQRRGARR
ncbi:MAG: type III pantothenate kinase [Myxococcota bacterium]|jgi:type III pantothenate kinase